MEDLRPATLVAALKDEKKDYHVDFTKSAGLIGELVDKTIYPLLNNKSAGLIRELVDETIYSLLNDKSAAQM